MTQPAQFAGRDAGLSKAAYTRLENTTRRKVADIAQALEDGQNGRPEAYQGVAQLLRNGTAEAWRLGKAVGWGSRHAPVLLTPAEQQRADNLSRVQCARLRSWLLAAGPLVRPGVQGIGPRLDMYAQSLHAAYQSGLAFGLLQSASQQKGMALHENDPIWLWERSKDPGICSCQDCISREARSKEQPYTLLELLAIGFPAQGHTKCLTRCRCRVRVINEFGDAILARRAHHRAKSTAYHGVVDTATTRGMRSSVVGNRYGKHLPKT